MERMLVVVFDDEGKADEGARALNQLDASGDISVYAEAVIKKNNNGTVTVVQEGDDLPVGLVGGTAIGAIVGILRGSYDPDADAAAGALAGSLVDLDSAGVNVDFLMDVSGRLRAGKWAVVADMSEEAVTPVDSAMKSIGGSVFRVARQNVEDEQDARDVKALKTDLDELNKEEKSEARQEKKEELRGKISELHDKLHAKLEHAKQRSDEREKETKAKIDALEKRAETARGDAKAKFENRIADLRKHSESPSTVQQVQPQQQS